ncbi:MAG: cupin domain-containing protein [Planctomycetia bacterium]|jgi:quercetin dioxygenase-like cupin family protein|nr:cupin domain-containing protein [Planctomycetia bacterium]
MIRTRLDSSETTAVELDGVKDVAMRVLLGAADDMPNFSMRHFVVQPGGHTPKHAHDYEHQVIVLAGDGEADHGDETVRFHPGDVMYVEADQVHQFRNTGSEPVEFICLVPRTRGDGSAVPGS